MVGAGGCDTVPASLHQVLSGDWTLQITDQAISVKTKSFPAAANKSKVAGGDWWWLVTLTVMLSLPSPPHLTSSSPPATDHNFKGTKWPNLELTFLTAWLPLPAHNISHWQTMLGPARTNNAQDLWDDTQPESSFSRYLWLEFCILAAGVYKV